MVLTNDENPAEFTIKLSNPLTFNESWKVGLTELTLSNIPTTFSTDDFLVCKNFQTKSEVTIKLNSETVTTGEKLIEIINEKLAEKKLHPSFQFSFEELTHKTKVELDPNRGVQFSKRLSSVLSFDEIVENKKKYRVSINSQYCTDVRMHFWNIYVYSNLTKPIILGETLYPVLQTLSVECFDGSFLTKTYSPPMFMPLATHYIPDIEIKICDELGRPLKFKSGCSTLCKLLFKRDN